jgi:hypothetical protein
MARIDDYQEAVELGRKNLEGKDLKQVAEQSGAGFKSDSARGGVMTLNFLNKAVTIAWPGPDFLWKESGEGIPVQQEILLLHYLHGALNAQEVSGKWIAYQEVPDGRFYLDAFLRRAKGPMVGVFGNQPEVFAKLATEVYDARPFDQGDVSVVVQALPKIPVALILWKGDEEFPPEGNLLFDESISRILSAEDIAWLSGMIIYPLMGMAGK